MDRWGDKFINGLDIGHCDIIPHDARVPQFLIEGRRWNDTLIRSYCNDETAS